MQDFAKKYGVAAEIHEEDMMFRFLFQSITKGNHDQAVQIYFEGGAEDSKKISDLINNLQFGKDLSVLEFASGYGRVSRHLIKCMPEAKIMSVDIHEKAIRFIQDIGLTAQISSPRPENFNLPLRYDVVFALSFFSHLPKKTFGPWVSALWEQVHLGGSLIFTTHGKLSIQHFPPFTFDEDGFYFFPISEQDDLPLSEYGSTINLPVFLESIFATLPNVASIEFFEGSFWGHQDLYIVQKCI